MLDWLNGAVEAVQTTLIANDNWMYLTNGLMTTLIVTVAALAIGLVGGVILAIIRVSAKDNKPSWKTPGGFFLNLLNALAGFYITIIRGTPSTLQLLIMFNIFLVSVNNLVLVAILTFGLNSAAYMAELFRGGIRAVDKGEIEAARSLGLNYLQTMKTVVLPQAFKNSLPALGNEVITLFKETSISGFIGLADLTRGSQIIITNTYRAIPPLFASAAIYLFFVLVLERLFRYLEERRTYA